LRQLVDRLIMAGFLVRGIDGGGNAPPPSDVQPGRLISTSKKIGHLIFRTVRAVAFFLKSCAPLGVPNALPGATTASARNTRNPAMAHDFLTKVNAPLARVSALPKKAFWRSVKKVVEQIVSLATTLSVSAAAWPMFGGSPQKLAQTPYILMACQRATGGALPAREKVSDESLWTS
jgi:hypothetical protein